MFQLPQCLGNTVNLPSKSRTGKNVGRTVMASVTEQEECAHRSKRQHADHSEDIVQLPYEILEAIFRTLPTSVVHRVGAVCKDWNSIVKDDELWRLRCGLSELPSGFSSCFAYAQRQTMREQALDHLYGRAGLTQNWRKGLQLLGVLADAGDDYAMALYGWAWYEGAVIRENSCAQLLEQSKHVIARAFWTLCGIGDEEEGYRLLTTECDTSDPHVQYLLGRCFQYGFGCEQDGEQAMQHFERAGNHIMALIKIACLLNSSYRSISDRRRAIALYSQAATQGYVRVSLGSWYERGIPGVLEKDIVEAKHWYLLSAEQGDEEAVEALKRLNN